MDRFRVERDQQVLNTEQTHIGEPRNIFVRKYRDFEEPKVGKRDNLGRLADIKTELLRKGLEIQCVEPCLEISRPVTVQVNLKCAVACEPPGCGLLRVRRFQRTGLFQFKTADFHVTSALIIRQCRRVRPDFG